MSWLEPQEVATIKGVSRIAVFKAIQRGALRAERALLKGQIIHLVKPEWLEDWKINAHNQQAGQIARTKKKVKK